MPRPGDANLASWACPRCGHPDSGRRDIFSTWVCESCGAALRGSRFYFGFWVAVAVTGIVLHLVAMRMGWPVLDVLAAVMILGGLGLFLLGEKVAVVAVGPCCPGCFYDLSKLPAGAPCPECGRTATPASAKAPRGPA